VTESVALRLFEGSIMPQSQRASRPSFHSLQLSARLSEVSRAQMMLVSIEPSRARGVDLQTFECAVCNQILTNFAALKTP